MPNPLWRPEKTRVTQSTLAVFSKRMAPRAGKSLDHYDDLHRFSVTEPAEFWSGLWDFAEVVGDKGRPPYLVNADKLPGARFFPDARLNFAENALRRQGPEPAIVFWGEDKVKRRMSWDELRGEVARAAAALREAGVVAGAPKRSPSIATWPSCLSRQALVMLCTCRQFGS